MLTLVSPLFHAHRLTVSAVLAGAVLVAGCAGEAMPDARAPGKESASERRARLESIIDRMLAEERHTLGLADNAPPNVGRDAVLGRRAASPPPVAMPGVVPQQDQTAGPQPRDTDTFKEDVFRIQEAVPTWNNGTGVALKFLKESTGKRLSLVYVDPTPPEYREDSQLWMIQAQARTDSRTLGHFVLLLKDLRPGRFEGSKDHKDVIMSISMGGDWDGRDPETSWSINEASWCELVLRQTAPGILEGDFRAKLVDNEGTGFHTIESGYLFIKQ